MDRQDYQKAKNTQRKQTHKRVELYIPLGEFKHFSKRAKKEAITPNRLILSYATAYRDQQSLVPKSLKKRLDEHNFLVRNIANNVNQIAHNSNIFHDAEKKAVLKNLEQLNQQVADLISQLNKP